MSFQVDVSLVEQFGLECGKIRVLQKAPALEKEEMAKQLSVLLKAVVPFIPSRVEKKAMLKEDLHQMGCHGLMEWPWCLKYKEIMAELLQEQDNRWVRTVYQDPDKWIAAAWHKVYNSPIRGKGMAT